MWVVDYYSSQVYLRLALFVISAAEIFRTRPVALKSFLCKNFSYNFVRVRLQQQEHPRKECIVCMETCLLFF